MKINSSSLIQSVITGMGFGFPITVGCAALIGGYDESIGQLLTWVVASALFGVITTVFLDSNLEMPFPVALACHCVCCFAVAAAAAYLCGYSNSLLNIIKGVLPLFVIIYAAVYLICIAIMKHHEKQINNALNQE